MLEKVNTILDLFSPERPELSVIEIAARLRRPRSTVYRVLARTAEAGFLDHDPISGKYRIGMRLAALGELARHSTSLQRVAYPHLLRLGETSGGETVVLMVRSGDEGVTLDVVEGFHPVRIPHHLGGRFPLHATAGGKVFLAHLPAAELERILKTPRVRCTKLTVTDPGKIRRELELTRRRGYGIAEGEWLDDLHAVAAPVRDHRGNVVAAIGVACPTPRWNPKTQRSLVQACVTAANDVSGALGYRTS